MDSDMDLLLDMVPDENVIFETIEPGKTNEYYQGHAEYILRNIDTVDHYFHFVNTIIKNYHTLTDEQQKTIKGRLGIKPIIQEKIVYKEKVVYKDKKKKAKVNNYDDY